MATPPRTFVDNEMYHIFNRGVAKQTIYHNTQDYDRFIRALVYYQQRRKKQKLSVIEFEVTDREPPFHFDILSYCLMPNHFHLLLRQQAEGGIRYGLADIQDSYTRYYNTKYERIGPLLQGTFRAVAIESDEQFLQVSRYILLNPYAARLTNAPLTYPWSSAAELLDRRRFAICDHELFRSSFADPAAIRKFVTDYADYARMLETRKDALLD